MLRRLAPLVYTGLVALAAPTHAELIFSQDFSAGGAVATYESTPGTATTFDDIGAIGDTIVGIVNDALVITGPLSGGTASPNGGGFFRQDIGGAVAPTLMTVQYTLTVDWAGNQFQGNAASFSIGNITQNQTAYQSLGGVGAVTAVKADPQGSSYVVGIGATTVAVAKGTSVLITLYLNNSGVDQAYTGIDGQARTLVNDSLTLFVGNTALIQNQAVTMGNGALADIRFSGGIHRKSTAISYIFDDIAVYDSLLIPEPGSFALFGVGGLLMRLRLRRRC